MAPTLASSSAYRRLGARYPQSLLSRRRAASLPARKSQTKSQRRPTSGDTQLRQATVKPGQVPTERHQATSSDARNMTGGQGVAGSNPAVPTGQSLISNAATGLRAAAGSAPRSQQGDETAVVRRVEGHNATGQQGLPSPPKVSSPPGRTCLRVKTPPVHIRLSRLALGNTSRGPWRDPSRQAMETG